MVIEKVEYWGDWREVGLGGAGNEPWDRELQSCALSPATKTLDSDAIKGKEVTWPDVYFSKHLDELLMVSPLTDSPLKDNQGEQDWDDSSLN